MYFKILNINILICNAVVNAVPLFAIAVVKMWYEKF